MMSDVVNVSNKELRMLSLEFRTVAGRLLNTPFEEDLNNAKRFLDFVEGEKLIRDFIGRHNIREFDIKGMVKTMDWSERFDMPTDKSEEIAFIYQLLRFGVDTSTPLHILGRGYAYSTKFQDMVQAFTRDVVYPLVLHVNNYLASLVEDADRSGDRTINVTVSGSGQANVAVSGSRIEAANTAYQLGQEISETIDRLLFLLEGDQMEARLMTEMTDLLRSIQSEVGSEQPRRSTIKVLGNYLRSVLSGLALSAGAAEGFDRLLDLIDHVVK